jgi:hypothetical protein
MMTRVPDRRPPVAARRMGYAIAAALTAGFWYVVNVQPGWQALPFLTEDTARILPLLDLSLAVSLVANVLYLAYDAPWWRSFGDVVTTSVGLAVLVLFWRVFPFEFTGSFDWSPVVRVTLVLAIVGSIIGIAANVVTMVSATAHPGHPGHPGAARGRTP